MKNILLKLITALFVANSLNAGAIKIVTESGEQFYNTGQTRVLVRNQQRGLVAGINERHRNNAGWSGWFVDWFDNSNNRSQDHLNMMVPENANPNAIMQAAAACAQELEGTGAEGPIRASDNLQRSRISLFYKGVAAGAVIGVTTAGAVYLLANRSGGSAKPVEVAATNGGWSKTAKFGAGLTATAGATLAGWLLMPSKNEDSSGDEMPATFTNDTVSVDAVAQAE